MSKEITILVPRPVASVERAQLLLKEGEILLTRANIIRKKIITLGGGEFTAAAFVGIGIKRNIAQCTKCGDTIESLFRYHSVFCSCGRLKIDGGCQELIRRGTSSYKELSSFYKI